MSEPVILILGTFIVEIFLIAIVITTMFLEDQHPTSRSVRWVGEFIGGFSLVLAVVLPIAVLFAITDSAP